MSDFTHQTTPPQEPIDPSVIMRFLTLGGATVTVTNYNDTRFYAHCLGCDWTNLGSDSEASTRDDANDHAGNCRSMPKPEATR